MMKKKIAPKDFKAVEFMRTRRNELSELYSKDPAAFRKRLDETSKKFKSKFQLKKKQAA